MIAIGAGCLSDSVAAEPGTTSEKPQSPAAIKSSLRGSRAGSDPKVGTAGSVINQGREPGRGATKALPGAALEAVNPPVPDFRAPAGKPTGEATPDPKTGELPAVTPGVRLADPASGAIPGDTGLFEPTLGEEVRSRFRKGSSVGTDRFPIWQDPWLPGRKVPSKTDLLTSPLYDPQSESGTTDLQVDGGVPEPPPLVAPGLYGRPQRIFYPGQGGTARPWSSNFSVSLENGYDSNGFQVPNAIQGNIPQAGQGSFTTGVGLRLAMQWLTTHSAFTFSTDAAATYYWNRDRDRTLYNIPALALVYLNKLDTGTQLTANLTLAYLSQADFSNVYSSQNVGGVDYLTLSSKIDVLHKWARHFSTNTSIGANLLYYPEGTNIIIPIGIGSNISGNVLDLTFGNEFRFETSTKLTWVLEGRYGLQEALDNSALNSDTLYFLAGLDWIWLRHVTASVRVGTTVRTSDAFGTSSSPYFEFSGTFKTGRYSSLALNTRYGLEFTNLAGDAAPSYRVGLSYQQQLGRRLSGSANINYLFSNNTQFGPVSNSAETIDFTLGLQYQISRPCSVAAQYGLTRSDSSNGLQSFDRSRATLSLRYNF